MASNANPKGGNENTKLNDFRAAVRKAAAEEAKSVMVYLSSILMEHEIDENGEKVLTLDGFRSGIVKVKGLKSKFSASDLEDIFIECDEGQRSTVTVEELAEFCSRTISRARALAMKLRNAIMKIARGEVEYRNEFASFAGGPSKIADLSSFASYAEELLNMSINDIDAMGMMALFDMDGDSKLSCDDFVSFILGQTTDAFKALQVGSGELIVDIKISNTGQQESELARNGYRQIFAERGAAQFGPAGGSFGKGESIWVWSRKQGTCAGRLKPIVDLQLSPQNFSSAMVLSGYVRVPESVGGQWLWVRHASSEEEEQDALMDVHITTGKAKAPTDAIWSSPGVGWIRVDGNFARSSLVEFGKVDAFVWFLPARTRALDIHMMSPIRASVALTDDVRKEKVLASVRVAIRHYVPVSEMKRLAFSRIDYSLDQGRVDLFSDYIALYHKFDHSGKSKLSKSKFGKLLSEVGACIESEDLTWCFYCFNVFLDSYVTLQEYCDGVSLTDHEIDLAMEKIRLKMLSASSSKTEASSAGQSEGSIASSNKIRDHKILSQVFSLINTSSSGILNIDEILSYTAKIEIFVTEQEAARMLTMMDVGGDGRVEESDFIDFMKRSNDVLVKKASRLRVISAKMRTWFQRGLAGAGPGATNTLNHQWQEIKKRRETSSGFKFPGYLCSFDMLLLGITLGDRMSASEARELMLLIAPDKCGRINLTDLQVFMTRSCRMFGELEAILERDLFKGLLDAYKAHRECIRKTGSENPDLRETFDNTVKEIVRQVQGSFVAAPAVVDGVVVGSGSGGGSAFAGNTKPIAHDVVSILQLKSGIETSARNLRTTETQLLNVEEWAIVACKLGAVVSEESQYGVRVKPFLLRFCTMIAGSLTDIAEDEVVTIEVLCRDLQRMIVDEARANSKGKDPDYNASFNLFDEDGNGCISTEEFRKTMFRLKLMDNFPESQIPALIAMFDTNKKGYINVDDFMKFVKANKKLVPDEDNDDYDVDDEEEDTLKLSSNTPPVHVTKNADCDWLSWFLWKECCRLEPEDPESMVTELERACAEAEVTMNQGTVTVVDLWNILFELKIRGSMSKEQFEKGVRHVLQDVSSAKSKKDADQMHVDYEALCRYVTRMGHAYNGLVQEKKKAETKLFTQLLETLLKEFTAMIEESIASASAERDASGKRNYLVSEVPRFEKVLKRLDNDSDGCVTIREFRIALKRLHCRDDKKWTTGIVRRLFEKVDSKRPNLLSIADLGAFVRKESGASKGADSKKESMAAPKTSQSNFDDDEDDEVFSRQKVINDQQLMRKVSETLLDSIQGSSTAKTDNAMDLVKQGIRKFFHRSDPDQRGLVTEERFRAFSRRSGLQDRLTAMELRRLFDKLRRNNLGKSKVHLIDYERLCKLLTDPTSSIAHSKAQAVLMRFQDAMTASAAMGRPFLNLCALFDPKDTGTISKEELILCAKIMNCTLVPVDIEAMKEVLAEDTISPDDVVHYKELQYAIENFIPKDSTIFEPKDEGRPHSGRTSGALPSYAVPGLATTFSSSMPIGGTRSLLTPGGLYVSTPGKPHENLLGRDRMNSRSERILPSLGRIDDRDFAGSSHQRQDVAVYMRIMAVVSERVQRCVDERSRLIGAPFSLKRLFEAFDVHGSGFLPVRTFQGALDDIGVIISTSDLFAINALYGRPEDEKIDFESFCADVSVMVRPASAEKPYPDPHHHNGGRPSSAIPHYQDYGGSRVAHRVRELRMSGVDLRDVFGYYDVDNTGLVDVRRFRDIIQKHNILQTELQLSKAIEDFSSLSDRGLIVYEQFLKSIEGIESGDRVATGAGGLVVPPLVQIPAREKYAYGSGYDGLQQQQRASRHSSYIDDRDYDGAGERWLSSSQESTPRLRNSNGGFSHATENLSRFKSTLADGRIRDLQYDPDESSDSSAYGLLPPKVSDSISFGRQNQRPPSGYNGRSSYDAGSPSRRNLGHSSLLDASPNASFNGGRNSIVSTPRTSPSKVGSAIWGRDTPLSLKGQVPYIDDSTWCCAVCLYADNPTTAQQCVVCDSPNYSNRKEYQVKEQCQNCTFQNGQFATDCEMCGKPLSKRNQKSKSTGQSSQRW